MATIARARRNLNGASQRYAAEVEPARMEPQLRRGAGQADGLLLLDAAGILRPRYMARQAAGTCRNQPLGADFPLRR